MLNKIAARAKLVAVNQSDSKKYLGIQAADMVTGAIKGGASPVPRSELSCLTGQETAVGPTGRNTWLGCSPLRYVAQSGVQYLALSNGVQSDATYGETQTERQCAVRHGDRTSSVVWSCANHTVEVRSQTHGRVASASKDKSDPKNRSVTA